MTKVQTGSGNFTLATDLKSLATMVFSGSNICMWVLKRDQLRKELHFEVKVKGHRSRSFPSNKEILSSF